MSENKEKLPLELLREKYIPVVEFPDKYGIDVSVVMKLVDSNRINKAEFRAPGDRNRTLHVNYEEVLKAIEEDNLK